MPQGSVFTPVIYTVFIYDFPISDVILNETITDDTTLLALSVAISIVKLNIPAGLEMLM